MGKYLFRFGGMAALTAAFGLAACSDNSAIAPEFDPSEAITEVEYTLVKSDQEEGFICTFTSDREGGLAECGPHTLNIPANAFSPELVDFHIEVVKGEEVRIRLYATSQGSSILNDVGAAGFDVPLTASLKYGKDAELEGDTSELSVLWLKPDGTIQVIPTTIDSSTNTAIADIDHFSEFALGWP